MSELTNSTKTFCLTEVIKIIDLSWPINKMEYDLAINLMIGIMGKHSPSITKKKQMIK